MMHGDHLPFLSQDIILEILMRLPVKILIRCKLVCKNWKHFIEAASSEHDDHYSSTLYYNPSLIFCDYNRTGQSKLHLIDCDMQVRVLSHPLFDYSSSTVSLINSCNGLLCIRVTPRHSPLLDSILLWNPTIQKVRQVATDYRSFSYVGLGYLGIVKDYKLVRICADKGSNSHRAEIYSLHTRSWRQIECRNLEGVALWGRTVWVGGSIFWLVGELDEGRWEEFHMTSPNWRGDHCIVIASFDMAKEEFGLIRTPVTHSIGRSYAFLHAYDDNKLAMICRILGSTINLWVMEEGLSWNLKYSIQCPSSGLCYPCGIWNKNKLVCKNINEQEEETQVSTTTTTTTLSFINIHSFVLERVITIHSRLADCSDIVSHCESIVPLGYSKD